MLPRPREGQEGGFSNVFSTVSTKEAREGLPRKRKNGATSRRDAAARGLFFNKKKEIVMVNQENKFVTNHSEDCELKTNRLIILVSSYNDVQRCDTDMFEICCVATKGWFSFICLW